jgi:hypothetical protein
VREARRVLRPGGLLTTAEVVIDLLEGTGFADIELLGPDGTKPFALGDRRLVSPRARGTSG